MIALPGAVVVAPAVARVENLGDRVAGRALPGTAASPARGRPVSPVGRVIAPGTACAAARRGRPSRAAGRPGRSRPVVPGSGSAPAGTPARGPGVTGGVGPADPVE